MGILSRLTDQLADLLDPAGAHRGRNDGITVQLNFDIRLFEPNDGLGRGIVFRDADGDEPVPWERWADVTNYALVSLPVVGADRYHGEALQQPEFGVGRELSLVREPENPADPNAVAVLDYLGRYHVGYIPREYAAAVGEGVREGVRAFSAWETYDGDRRVGLRIVLANASLGDVFADAMREVRNAAGTGTTS